jgi:PAS domain S-box-containing protein
MYRTLVAVLVGSLLAFILSLRMEQFLASDRYLGALLIVGALGAAFVAGFLVSRKSVASLHKAIHQASEGALLPAEAPKVAPWLVAPVIKDYNVLVHNFGSLFHEMEQCQLWIIGERNRNDAILRSLPGVLLTVDADFRVTLSNRLAEELFGFTSEDLLGKSLFDLLRVNDEGRDLLRDAFLYDQQVSNKEIALSDGATLRHFTLNVTFFKQSRNAEESCAAVMLQDITSFKKLQEITHQSEKFIAMGQFAGGVAHELNTPLGTIIGYAQLLNMGGASEEKRRQYGQEIYNEAKRCAGIIDHLLAYARRDRCDPENCEINGAIRDVVETICNCQGRRYKVRVESKLTGNPLVQGASGQLDIVLVNIIMNAVQATVGETDDALVTVESEVTGGSAVVTITDNGPGVAPELRSRIFDPFFTTKQEGSGVGLGLAISQSIVTRIGGTLRCDPDFQGGARFVMTLPLATRERIYERACETV